MTSDGLCLMANCQPTRFAYASRYAIAQPLTQVAFISAFFASVHDRRWLMELSKRTSTKLSDARNRIETFGMTELLGFYSFSQRRHALLEFLEGQLERNRTGDPDEVGGFFALGEMAAIDFAHAAAKLGALGRGADALRREKGNGARLAWLYRVARKKIKRHPAVGDAAPLVARGVEDGAASDDARARERFGGGRTGGKTRFLCERNRS
jgi:hypothetical protein